MIPAVHHLHRGALWAEPEANNSQLILLGNDIDFMMLWWIHEVPRVRSRRPTDTHILPDQSVEVFTRQYNAIHYNKCLRV